MIFKAILRNKNEPGYGQATIPFPIPGSEYDHTIGLLEGMDMTRRGSNPRPPRCERGALPAELRAHMFYFWNVRFCFSFTRNSQSSQSRLCFLHLIEGPLSGGTKKYWTK